MEGEKLAEWKSVPVTDVDLAGGSLDEVGEGGSGCIHVSPLLGPTRQFREKSLFVLPIALKIPKFASCRTLESDCLPGF